MTDNHMRFLTKAPYFGNFSLHPDSPSLLCPRSTLLHLDSRDVRGCGNVIQFHHVFRKCRLIHLKDSVVPVTLERATSVYLEFPKDFHKKGLIQ